MRLATRTFIILEDHPMMRDALVDRLVCHSADTRIAYAGDSISDAVRVAEADPPDCVILDLDLGDGRPPLETVTQALKIGAPILVVSAAATPRSVQGAMSRGARGYMSKQSAAHEFEQAVEIILRGEPYISAELICSSVCQAGMARRPRPGWAGPPRVLRRFTPGHACRGDARSD